MNKLISVIAAMFLGMFVWVGCGDPAGPGGGGGVPYYVLTTEVTPASGGTVSRELDRVSYMDCGSSVRCIHD